ncbi:hypothetical protein FACS189421_10520 [Bacteroidia bacterium]|nr:hypothetical protein FACS189421_10520 [Bacteroidia bacterium]GHT47683.1 hypothetical protein FACS189440_08940 [Bacteroidia bacterium]
MKKLTFYITVVVMVICFSKSFAANPVDVTYLIVNPSFEDNQSDRQASIPGWTKSIAGDDNFSTRSNTVNATTFPTFEKDGNIYAQYWYATALPDHQLSQVISDLPDGQYTLTAMIGAQLYESESIVGLSLFAGDNQTIVTDTDKGGKDVVVNAVVTDGMLTIGYKVESSNAKFVVIDNFRLVYNGTTGINQPDSNGITVYPTVTQGAVMVNTPAVAEILLSDITGKIFDRRNSAGGVYELNLSNKLNGIYFVTVITENKKAVYKVLKK